MGLFAFYSVRGYGFDTVNNKAEVMKCMIARLGPFPHFPPDPFPPALSSCSGQSKGLRFLHPQKIAPLVPAADEGVRRNKGKQWKQ